MAAFSSILSDAGGWAFEDPNPISTTTTTLYFNPNHDYNHLANANDYQNFCPNSDLDHHLPFVDLPPPVNLAPSQPPELIGGEAVFCFNSGGDVQEAMTPEKKRKLYHNASERDRRKKINYLYSTLRAVLPINDRMRLSNPDTVTRALKYIPELQNQVNVLTKQKQELLSRSITTPTPSIFSSSQTSSYSVQAMQVGNGEISIQISMIKSIDSAISIVPVSEVLRELENENGVIVIQVSSSESYAGRVFHSIHVKVDATHELICEILREKILKLCHNWDQINFAFE